MVRKVLLALIAASIIGQLSAQTGPRFALVIGNSAYKGGLAQLKNPGNDARDVGVALKRLGYSVEILVDADQSAMEAAAARLSESLGTSAQATGLFYFAGHGVQSQGVNYLIPIDASIPAEAFLKTKALSAQIVLDLMQGAGNRLNLVILDACRDNPFAWARSAGSRGLSVVGNQPPGSVIVFATSAGSVAQDGTGQNGLFTQEFLKNLEEPGLDLNTMLDRTAQGVQNASANRQNPAIYKQFFGTAYLGIAPEASSGQGLSSVANSSTAPTLAITSTIAPTMIITRSYGSLVVTARSTGALYLDGQSLGELPAGAEARLDNIEVGDRSVELRFAGGEKEIKVASVQKGQATSVNFIWGKPSAMTPPASTIPTEQNVYKIGDTGPAGGIVFYDKGYFSDGWRYLEAAPPSNQSMGIQWSISRSTDIKTGTAVGTGKANTETIIAAQGSGNYAAALCKRLSINGFSDWFLPSKDELNLMYTNLKKKGLGGFGDSWFWSSSQNSSTYAWEQGFSDGAQDDSYKGNGYDVRAIRAFGDPESVIFAQAARPVVASPQKAYKVGDIGPAGGIIFYDKGYFDNGWRYMEAAPMDQSSGIQWFNGSYMNIYPIGDYVGAGKTNTEAIIAVQGPGDYAASLCNDFTINGYSDWFLPSRDELLLMFTKLKLYRLGGFDADFYWSSSQTYKPSAWIQNFSDGSQSNGITDTKANVRAVRAF